MELKEYTLGELLDYKQPTPYIVNTTDYDDSYSIPVLTAGKSFIIGYTNETTGIYDELPVIIFDDFTTSTQFVNFKFKVKSSAMKILVPKVSVVNPKYIYYLMQTIKFDHSTHKRYWIQQYSKIKVHIPSLDNQDRIVDRIEELFSELDKAEETLLKTKAQLEVYKQSVLKEAFEGNLTVNWRNENRFGLEEIKESISSAKTNNTSTLKMQEEITLPTIPENWQWITINDITNGVEYGTSKKSSKSGEIPVIRMGNIQNGKIDWTDLVYSSDKEEIEKYKLHYNDVLFNRTNSPEHVGKTAVYKGEKEAIFAGYLIRINHFGCINSDYLTYYLNSFLARQYSNKVKTDGVNQSNINGNKLKTYPFPLCSLQEQEQIVLELEARLSEFNEIFAVVEKTLMQSKALKQSILKEAFEGKLV